MPVAGQVVHLSVLLDAAADPLEVDGASRRLWEELERTYPRQVRLVGVGAPAGSRGVDIAAATGVVVTLLSGADSLLALLRRVSAWTNNSRKNSVEVVIGDRSIKVGKARPAEQEVLIRGFLASIEGGDD